MAAHLVAARIFVQHAPQGAVHIRRNHHTLVDYLSRLLQVVEVVYHVAYSVQEHRRRAKQVDCRLRLCPSRSVRVFCSQPHNVKPLVGLCQIPTAQPMNPSCHLHRVLLFLLGVYIQHRRAWSFLLQFVVISEFGHKLLHPLAVGVQYCGHQLSEEKRLTILLVSRDELNTADGTEAHTLVGKQILRFRIRLSQVQDVATDVNRLSALQHPVQCR